MDSLQNPPPPQLHLDSIKAVKVLGKGAMGTVFLAYDTSKTVANPPLFALKVVEKSAKPDAERRARWETAVLASLKPHPFLPTLVALTSHSRDLAAWAVPYCQGGDLNILRHRQTDKVFSPAAIRFYLAEILCALHHLHSSGLVYRDLKPENVLIQLSGHVTLTDFDLSRHLSLKSSSSTILPHMNNNKKGKSSLKVKLMGQLKTNKLATKKPARVSPVGRRTGERSNSFVGTEEYVSPEMVRGDGHEFAVDWWALGVLAYEMHYGKTPFRGANKKDTFRNILMKEPEFVGKRTALTDLIGGLLEKDPVKRLGYFGGAEEIKAHQFFRGLSWDLLTEVLRPPFVPSTEEETVTDGGFDVTEYFKGLKVTKLPSGFPSMSSDVSLTEF